MLKKVKNKSDKRSDKTWMRKIVFRYILVLL